MLTRLFEIRSSVQAKYGGKRRSKQFADTLSPVHGPPPAPTTSEAVRTRSGALASRAATPTSTWTARRSGERGHDIDADSILRWPMPGARMGRRWAWLGDVDGDQRPEFAAAALGSTSNPPPGVELTLDWPAKATPGPNGVQGAILVFGNTPPGEVEPQQAKLIVMGADAGDVAGFWVMAGPGDVSGDGLGDLARHPAATACTSTCSTPAKTSVCGRPEAPQVVTTTGCYGPPHGKSRYTARCSSSFPAEAPRPPCG